MAQTKYNRGVSYRYRAYPGDAQEAVIVEHCGQARLVWNLALEQMNHCLALGVRCDWNGWDPQLVELRDTDGLEWLGAGSSSVQQQALRQLCKAFRGFFANPAHLRAAPLAVQVPHPPTASSCETSGSASGDAKLRAAGFGHVHSQDAHAVLVERAAPDPRSVQIQI